MSQDLRALFDPNALHNALEKRGNMATALRQLADEIDAGRVSVRLYDFRGHGFTDPRDQRAHVLVKLDVASEIRQTISVPELLPETV